MTVPVLHVRTQGNSEDVEMEPLGLSAESTDKAIRDRLARYYDKANGSFDRHVIDRQEGGDMVVRPEAVYG